MARTPYSDPEAEKAYQDMAENTTKVTPPEDNRSTDGRQMLEDRKNYGRNKY